MAMEELILELEIMSNIYQAQIHNLKLATYHRRSKTGPQSKKQHW